jgi:hypothetical protein
MKNCNYFYTSSHGDIRKTKADEKKEIEWGKTVKRY